MSKLFYFKQFSWAEVHSLVLFEPIRGYHSGSEWTWEWWQWRSNPHSPKLQHCWNLSNRLFSVISRTLVGGGVLPLSREAVGVFYSPSRLRSHMSVKLTICRGYLRRLVEYSCVWSLTMWSKTWINRTDHVTSYTRKRLALHGKYIGLNKK